MEEHITKVGKHLLDLVMFQIYGERAELLYREYIQNASDAIKQAIDEGVLDRSQVAIHIEVDKFARKICIKDNGTGIESEEVLDKLLNIADSSKDGYQQAGQFGIGRLSGAGYCNKMIFKTSYKGEASCSILELDISKIREYKEETNLSATEIIDKCYKIERSEEESKEHYFQVELLDVLYGFSDTLLDENFVVEYIKDIAPIDFNMSFKQLFNTAEGKFKEYKENIPIYNISVNGVTDIRKSYGLTIEGTNDKIESLEFIEIKDRDDVLGWGWYAITAYSKAITVNDRNRGIRLRRLNILVGERDYLNKYFKEDRGNNYFYGEIYATHPKLQLNVTRTNLIANDISVKFLTKIKEEFRRLHDNYYAASKLKKVIQTANERKWDNDSRKEVEKARQSIEKKNGSVGKKIINAVENEYSKKSEISKIEPTKNIPQKKPELEERLKQKLGTDNYQLAKRIFSLYDKYCGESNKKLIEQITERVIKEL